MLLFKQHNINYHLYADDLQLYLPLECDGCASFTNFYKCLTEVKGWLANNFLQLNEDKTEFIMFGNKEFGNAPAGNNRLLSNNMQSYVKNLGVFLDSELRFDRQVNSVVKSSFFHLRKLSKLKPILSYKDLEIVVHAFVSTRLDYCNSLYLGISESLVTRLQCVQNAAVRFLTNTRKRDHITPLLISLHWLPVRYRIQYKVLMFVFKALHDQAPEYIKDMLIPYQSQRHLRFSRNMLLTIPRSRLRRSGDRAFSVAAPALWNVLPLSLKTSSGMDIFKKGLKTYLFNQAFGV